MIADDPLIAFSLLLVILYADARSWFALDEDDPLRL
jgi:hypothetical protein